MLGIAGLAAGPRAIETVRDNNRHGLAMGALNNITLNELETSYHRRLAEWRDEKEKFEKRQEQVAEAFTSPARC